MKGKISKEARRILSDKNATTQLFDILIGANKRDKGTVLLEDGTEMVVERCLNYEKQNN